MPEYGMRIESTSSSAVPLSDTAHEVRPGAVAFAWPLHSILPAVVNAPWAVPVTFRSLAQLALKNPRALVAVCSVTFHLKSVHELGAGIRFEEDQLPSSELLPAAVGPVGVEARSKPMQPAADTAAIDSTATRIRFFMFVISVGKRADFARQYSWKEKVYQPESPLFGAFYG